MPSYASLTPDEIAVLKGAVDDLIGTGDNVQTLFPLSFFPIVDTRIVTGELVGLGDGLTTIYQIGYFPIQSGTLEMRKTSVSGPLLVDPTHFSVNLATGVVTLTPTGVTFLGTETLHAKYTAVSTLELHSFTIAGPLLIRGTHYSVDPETGQVTLTPAGVTFLGTDTLHAKYVKKGSTYDTLTNDNVAMSQGMVQLQIQAIALAGEDEILRDKFQHAVGDEYSVPPYGGGVLEEWARERRNLLGPVVSTPIAETIAQSPTNSMENSVKNYKLPLYRDIAPGPPPDPAVPFPAGSPEVINFFGGNGNFASNERFRLSNATPSGAPPSAGRDEVTAINVLLTILPVGDRLLDPQFIELTASVTDEIAALTEQLAALNAIIAAGTNEIILAGDIADATTARDDPDGVTAFLAVTTAWDALLTGTPLAAVSDVNLLNRRDNEVLPRVAFIDGTRSSTLMVTLNKIWNERYKWVVMRASLKTGTLTRVFDNERAISQYVTLKATNAASIADVEAILANQ